MKTQHEKPVPSRRHPQQPSHLPASETCTLHWNSPDDSDNPRNFSLQRRICSTLAVTFLAFVSTLAASIYSAGIDDVASSFNISTELATLPLSLYNLGLAFGPLIGAPLSETCGRKVVYLLTSPVFALFVLGSGFANDIVALCLCRFFAGVFASPAISNASATIVDYTAGRYRAVSLAFYYSMPSCGAVLGSLVGGFVAAGESWRWTQWVTLMFLAVAYVPVCFTRETYKKTILEKRTKRLGVSGPPRARGAVINSVRHFATVLLVRPVHMLVTERIVTLVCMYSGTLFGLMYTYVVVSPWIYRTTYTFSPASQSLSFLGLVIGTVLAPLPITAMDAYIYRPRLKRFDANPDNAGLPFPPENRLFPALIGSITLPATLLAFAWTARPNIPWIIPIIFQSLAMLSSVMIYAPTNLFMLDSYGPLYGASASGAAMLTRYTLSAAFPLFSLKLYQTLGVGWATSLLGFLVLGMAPIPWLFVLCGKRLKGTIKYEVST